MNQYWNDYVLLKNEQCRQYFDRRPETDSILFILGAGFDERMCEGVKSLGNIAKRMDVWLIRFEEAQNSDSLIYSSRVDDNIRQLKEYVDERQISEHMIKMWDNSGDAERPVSDPNTAKFVVHNVKRLMMYDTIIVDISALPQNIYFVLLDKLLNEFFGKKEIFIIACENYIVDKKTNPVGISEEAHYFMGYGAAGNRNTDKPVVWIPVLGECDKERLTRCHDYIMQDAKYQEICPLVPFPSVNERRSDEIIMKFRKQLFDIWGVEKKNIIYGAETNPFQVYRRICETVDHYGKVLQPLNDEIQGENESCRFVFTAITSKLMAIGAFLASFNLKREKYNINIAGLYNRGYNIEKASDTAAKPGGNNEVYCLCLSDDGLQGEA